MKNLFLIYLFIICLISNSLGQNKSIYSGKVFDRESNKPISFCNVYIEYTSIGTITNNDGAFILSLNKAQNGNLCFSFVGYKTKKIPLSELTSNNIIELSKAEILLDEVIIMPDSTLLSFLRKAYLSINDNYPKEPTKLEGFYRETKLTDKDEYIYFSEAVLNVFKNSYKLSNDPGQVEVVESRKKVFPISNDVNNVKFYGGVFIPINTDFVKNRIEFINPKHFDKYSYKLTNILRQDGRIIYEISFNNKNDSLSGLYEGKFFLDKESLAYIMGEYKNTNRGIQDYNSSNFTPYRGVERNFFVQYFFYKNKWHLKYCKIFGKGFNNKYNSSLKYGDEFLTTNVIIDTVIPIPFEKRISYYDIFLDKAIPYEETKWKDYNIIQTNNDLLFSIENAKDVFKQDATFYKEKKIIAFTKKMNFNYGISLFQNKIPNGDYQVILDNNTITQNIVNKKYLYALDANITYLINKNLSLKYLLIVSLDKTINLETNGFGLGYAKNIKPKGKPLFVKVDLYGYKDLYGIIFDESLNNIEYNNKQISNSKLVTQIVRESWGIKPNLSLSYQATRLVELYLSCSYNFNITENYFLKFEEESGLFKTTYNKDIIDGTLNFNGSSLNLNIIDMNPFMFGIGFNLGFN